MNAEIIAVGSEMLTPFRQDTNSLYITEKLNELGVAVDFKTIAGDRLKHLADAVRHALSRVDLLVISGGLGPTEDDLTREAVAEAAPRQVVSRTLGRMTGTASTLAMKPMSRALAVMPPSALSTLSGWPASAAMASTTSRVCQATASSAARAMWALVT